MGAGHDARADAGGYPSAQTLVSVETKVARPREYLRPDTRPRVQRVALVAMTRLDREALCYAFNACQRLDARLDVLTGLPSEETSRAVIAARGGADTPWRVIGVDDEAAGDIFRYARNESGLLFLVSGIDDKAARTLRDRATSNTTGLGVPWVVVEGRKKQR